MSNENLLSGELAVFSAEDRETAKNRELVENSAVKRNYNDSVFRMLFKEKSALLSLYNALNGTDYQDEEALEVNTLENAIYMGRKNDVSFLIYGQVNVYEHQSTVNDNMPLRDLIYISKIYAKIAVDLDLYSTRRLTIPRPHFVVFYNGITHKEAVTYLKLSDSFEQPPHGSDSEEPELELKVRVININHGFNEELKESCRLLGGYTTFIQRIRENARSKPIEEAVSKAVDDCIRDNILKDFLRENRAEVTHMNIFEYDFEKHMALIAKESKEDGYELGRAAGKLEGMAEGRTELLLAILSDLGPVSDELSQQICAEQDETVLKTWVKLAVNADSLEEFEKQIIH